VIKIFLFYLKLNEMSHGNVLNIPVALDPRFSRGIGEELDQGNLKIC